jgi:hypothetical protein
MSQQSIFVILFTIVVLTTVALGYVPTGHRAAINASVIHEPSSQQTASRTQNKTDSWHTYRNEKYGFEFKYPSDWTVDYKEDGTVSSGWIVILSSPDELHSFSVRNPAQPERFIYEGHVQIVQIGHETYTAYLFPLGYECYGEEQDCSFFAIPINKNGDWYIFQGEGTVTSVVSHK